LLSIQPLRFPEKLIRWVLQFRHLYTINREIRLKSVLLSLNQRSGEKTPIEQEQRRAVRLVKAPYLFIYTPR